jgi:hypothetical protein
MNREDIIRMAREAGIVDSWDLNWQDKIIERFADLVASAEREKVKGEIETLYAMYELASRQRDYLMEQQNAQVAAMRGKMQ